MPMVVDMIEDYYRDILRIEAYIEFPGRTGQHVFLITQPGETKRCGHDGT